MLGRLFLLFTLVPALELYLLIQIGARLGPLLTFALVVGTGAIGATLARAEGLRVLREWQQALAQGNVPEDGVVSSALVLLGGVLLITPGVLTDCFGLAMLVPAVRRPIARMLIRQVQTGIASGRIHVTQSSYRGAGGGQGMPFRYDPFSGRPESDSSEVITVEGETVSERAALPDPKTQSPHPKGG